MNAFSGSLLRELVGYNVRVSEIAPGMVETSFSVTRFRGDKAAADKVYEGLKPLVAEDIAEEILWVASRPGQSAFPPAFCARGHPKARLRVVPGDHASDETDTVASPFRRLTPVQNTSTSPTSSFSRVVRRVRNVSAARSRAADLRVLLFQLRHRRRSTTAVRRALRPPSEAVP